MAVELARGACGCGTPCAHLRSRRPGVCDGRSCGQCIQWHRHRSPI